MYEAYSESSRFATMQIAMVGAVELNTDCSMKPKESKCDTIHNDIEGLVETLNIMNSLAISAKCRRSKEEANAE